jgi:hypothetical protein
MIEVEQVSEEVISKDLIAAQIMLELIKVTSYSLGLMDKQFNNIKDKLVQ